MTPPPPHNADAHSQLERMLKSEDTVSNLLAYLVALDPKPLAKLLGSPTNDLQVRRETNLSGRKGRSDFIVWNGQNARAIFELKVAASEHGDQLARYEEWAHGHSPEDEPPVQCFVVDLMAFDYGTSDRWQRKTLPEIAGLWTTSPNDQARLLATSMKAVFEGWVTQLESPLGAATSPVVASLAVKQASAELMRSSWALRNKARLVASRYFRVNGPNAATYHFLQYPNEPRHSRLSLDIRAGSSQDASKPWNFRIGVDIHDYDGTRQEAQDKAFQLATSMRPYLELEPFKRSLVDAQLPQLADALSGGRLGTGFKKDGFYQDDNLRLASQFALDITQISVTDLAVLMQHAIVYLEKSAVASS